MLTRANMLHYVAVEFNDAAKTDKLFVIQTLRKDLQEDMEGTIVEVKPDDVVYRDEGIFRTTTDGYFVRGIPLNPTNISYEQAVGILPDGRWVLGELSHIKADNEDGLPPHARITDPRYSDQSGVPAEGKSESAPPVVVFQWLPAAPWARECMPTPVDPDDVVNSKLELAMAKRRTAYVKAAVSRAALGRGWEDDIEALNEDDWEIPTPEYTARIEAVTYVPLPLTGDDVVAARDQATAPIVESLPNGVQAPAVFAAVTTRFLSAHTAEKTIDGARRLAPNIVAAELREHNRDARLGYYTASPALRAVK